MYLHTHLVHIMIHLSSIIHLKRLVSNGQPFSFALNIQKYAKVNVNVMRKLNTQKTSFIHKELTVRFTRQVKKGLDGIELEGQSNGEMK